MKLRHICDWCECGCVCACVRACVLNAFDLLYKHGQTQQHVLGH